MTEQNCSQRTFVVSEHAHFHVILRRHSLDVMAARYQVVQSEARVKFNAACHEGRLDVVRELLARDGDRRIDEHANNEEGFRVACKRGHVGVVCALIGLGGDRRIDVHAMEEAGFRSACWSGHLDVVRQLLALGGDRRIDVHARQEEGFREACEQGHLGVVRELLGLGGDRRIDVHVKKEEGFRWACAEGRLDVVLELLALKGEQQPADFTVEAGFREACNRGQLDVVRELLALGGDRRIDVHAGNELGFRGACAEGQFDVVLELLALQGNRRIDVHAENEDGFREACKGGRLEMVCGLLGLTGDRRIDVHADDEGGFRWACQQGHLNVVCELLALDGDRRIDVHAVEEASFRVACNRGHLPVLHELLALDGDRRPHFESVAGKLQHQLAHQLQLGSKKRSRDFTGLIRGCVTPQFILEAAMKHRCMLDVRGFTLADAQHRRQVCPTAAQATSHYVLLHALQGTPVSYGAGLLTGGASPALDALTLCAVLPGAECRHLVGELVGCGAAVPGGEEVWSIGEAFATFYRKCVWRGVSVPVDEGAKATDDLAALLCRAGRRGLVLRRSHSRAAFRLN